MRKKIFPLISLIAGLLIILFAPPFFTACENQEKDKTEIAPAQTEALTLAYAREQAPVYVLVQQTEAEAEAVEDTGESAVTDESIDISDPKWLVVSGISNALMLIVTTMFGRYWKKARDVLTALNEGLADNSLTTAEVKKIIAAWKG